MTCSSLKLSPSLSTHAETTAFVSFSMAALLAPAFGSFTEGFETADLKATKALLDELT